MKQHLDEARLADQDDWNTSPSMCFMSWSDLHSTKSEQREQM